MLGPITKLLAGREVILASASPRRKQIMENMGFPVIITPSTFEENLDKSNFSEPWQYVVETSKGKASEVAHRIKERQDGPVVIGADTVVAQDGDILEKPITTDNARRMLNKLNGHTHQVHTGVTIAWWEGPGGGALNTHSFHETTEVTFAELTNEMIESYLDSGEPLDKAGGYGIQGLGGTLVHDIHGDYFNVVGLPLHRLCVELLTLLGTTMKCTP